MSIWDAIVIGSGPAGIGAGAVLGEAGARVLVVDEAPAPGGQIWRGIEGASGRRAAILGPDYLAGKSEVRRLRASGAELAFSTEVWRVDPDGTVWLRDQTGLHHMRARFIIIATGAMERPVPLPGWTLPGVSTVGGLQTLLKREGILPNGPLALIGSGPLLYLYAQQAISAGKHDIIMVDTSNWRRKARAMRFLPHALLGQGITYLAKGAGLLWNLRRKEVAYYPAAEKIAIEQDTERGALIVNFQSKGQQYAIPVSRVGLHEGVIPESHLPRSLDCRMAWSGRAAAFHPIRDRNLCSSHPNIYISGDAGGIGGAMVALFEGQMAALSVLAQSGLTTDPQQERKARRQRQAHLAARPLIDAMYQPSPEIVTPPDQVIACRCEEVTCGGIRESLAAGAAGPNQIKAFLRCGMGPCQGRLCGPTLAALVAAHANSQMEAAGWLSIRSPLRPVTLGEAADLADQS